MLSTIGRTCVPIKLIPVRLNIFISDKLLDEQNNSAKQLVEQTEINFLQLLKKENIFIG